MHSKYINYNWYSGNIMHSIFTNMQIVIMQKPQNALLYNYGYAFPNAPAH